MLKHMDIADDLID